MSFFLSIIFLFIILFILIYTFHSSLWNSSIDNICNIWVSPFECGFLSYSSPYSSFTFGFVSFLVLFVLFDLEVSLFLNFCFNLSYYNNFFYYYIFLLVLCVGFTFELLSGSVKWLH
uniref:NADH-ubiquinone oxidoreductase chain 3 n=1 Tax=Paragyrodactylus variegatus TaxID=1415179 RepID=A0A076VB36_9PLAT|nr:NADH dehydrogenase subunit 3 [Paragyrodactylus variegatus]AIK25765.1 NADH dehydrogenase subunit 3 [Paragyrodactylus variegatus]